MNRFATLFGLALLLLLLAGCGGSAVDGPPEIRYGEDVCQQCQMIISEPRFAAAYVIEEGSFHRFDDIGEMFLHAHNHEEAVRTFWVHDYHDESWLEAEKATFVYDAGLVTPMGWGVVAFADESEAAIYRREHEAILLTMTELEEQIASGELRPEGLLTGPEKEHSPAHSNDE